MEKEKLPEGFSVKYASDRPIAFEEGMVAYHHNRKDKRLTDLLGVGGYTVVSKKMKEVLAPFEPQNAVFFPVPVYTTWDKKTVPYFLLHLLQHVDFVNRKTSDFDPYSDGAGLFKLRKLVMDEEKIGKRRIFRTRDLPMRVFVGEEVKVAIQNAGLTGVGFIPSEAFTKGVSD